MELTEQRMREIVRDGVSDALLGVGIDVHNPLDMQQDLNHLRAMRVTMQKVRSKSILTFVGLLVTGVVAAMFIAVKGIVHIAP